MINYKNGICYDYMEGKESTENLVFIHGSGCNRKFLRALAVKLSSYNCYLPDLPDHGKSDYCNCRSVEDYVDAIADFVSGMNNVTLIGHCLGGAVCLGVAARNIPSVKRCVIISSGAKFDKLDDRIHTMVSILQMDWGYFLKCMGSLHRPAVLLDLLNLEKSYIMLKDFAIKIHADLEYALEKINVPTLITVGTEDILALPEYSEKMHERIKDSQIIYFPGCQHMLPIIKRKKMAELIKDFLSSHPRISPSHHHDIVP